MGTCFLYGNGGGTSSSLNFFIKRYQTSDNLLADTPKENTIGIVTDAVLGTVMFRSDEASGSENNVLITCDTTNAVSDTSLMAWNTKVSGLSTNIALALTSCAQYLSGTWIPKTACIFMSGAWVQFSEAFLATISVTYPSGSTCTASCGNLEYEAPDATGSWTFTVPVSGTWTISITNGTNTSIRNVSITTSGQSESVTLSYIYWAFNKRNSVDYTGGWMRNTGSDAWSTYTPDTVIAVENGGSGPAWIKNRGIINDTAIDLTGFSTLYITVSNYTSAGTAGITETSDVGTSFVVSTSIGSAKTYAIDVSSYTGNYYIRMNSTGSQNNTSSYVTLGYRVSELWLE